MWWSDRFRHSAGVRTMVLALAVLPLAGCGFRPLYGESSGTTQALAEVRVAPIADRQGQILRNELLDRISPNGEKSTARYLLSVRYNESLGQLAIRRDDTATRANLRVATTFRLIEVSTGVTVYNGSSSATASYNLVQSDYANLVSRRAAQRRASKLVANDVTTQVAIYFNRLQQLRKRKSAK